MKKVILALLVSFFLVSTANAMDVGLGVSFSSNPAYSYYSSGAKIYMPMDISPSFRLEPYFMYLDDEIDSTGGSGPSTDSISLIEFGAGAFATRKLNPSTLLYFGAKLSYLNVEQEDITPTSTRTSDGDGFQIAPTLGFEYFFNENVSLGGEALWFYAEIDFDDYSSVSGPSSDSIASTGTDTEVILRFYF